MSRRTLQRAPDPHQALRVSIATRRDLFGTMGAMLLLNAAEAGPAKAAELDGELLASNVRTSDNHPDGTLLALAERFIACEQAIMNWPCDARPGTPEDAVQAATQRRMCDVQRALALQLGDLYATTAEGVAARARCLAAHNSHGDFSMDDPDTTTGLLLHYVMRDAAALGGSVRVVAPSPSPDAELLEVCATFDAWHRRYLAADFEKAGDNTPEGQAAAAEQRRCFDAQDPLVDRMCKLRAVTREGHAARARSLALWDAELMKPDPHDTGELLRAAIVRDLLAGSAVA